MLTPNYDTEFITRIAKGNIAAGAYVRVTNSGDWETRCTVKDEHGNEQEYLMTELQGWGYIREANMAFDLVEEFKGPHQKDLYGNTDIMRGRIHITKNVRGGLEGFKNAGYCTPSDHVISYRYTYRKLTDQEVVDMLLNEILYGVHPNLQSMSCVGSSKKGIDEDPNYRDGVYYLPNDKEYDLVLR